MGPTFRLLLLLWLSLATLIANEVPVEPGIRIEIGEKLLAHALQTQFARVASGMKVEVRAIPQTKLLYRVRIKHPGTGQSMLPNLSRNQNLANLVSKPLEALEGVDTVEFSVALSLETAAESTLLAGFDPNSMKIRTFDSANRETMHGQTVGAVLDFLKTRGFQELVDNVLTTYLGSAGSGNGLAVAGVFHLSNQGNGKVGIRLSAGKVNDLYGIRDLQVRMVYGPASEGSTVKTGRIEISGEAALGEK